MVASQIADSVAEILPELVRVRRDLHRHPELGFEEHRTQEVIEAWLRRHGWDTRRCAGTGVIGDRGGPSDGAVALRFDMDALPIHESTDLPWRSVHPGIGHKCGHDGHTTVGLGVAAILGGFASARKHNVRLLFQPAEEGVRGGGAKVMVAEGALQGVREVYGHHNWPGFPKGAVRVAAGPVMADVVQLEIEVRGKGGHGSQPHVCTDPIVAAAHVVTALQTVVARGVPPGETAVVSIGAIAGGTTHNVIPDTVSMQGTVRTFSPAVKEEVLGRIRAVVRGAAAAVGAEGRVAVVPEYPVLVNDPACAGFVADAATSLFGPEAVGTAGLPMTASEDFAFFAEERPAAYFFLGAGDPVGNTPGCHHPDFDYDDDLIATGVRLFTELARLRAGVGPAA